MLNLQDFTGINNVLPPEELAASDLTVASNVDVDLAGRVSRRAGFAEASAVQHKNVWQAAAFVLATRGAAGDLVNVTSNTVLLGALGHTRVWYETLPDGRTLFSNGVTQGVVNAAGSAVATWGVPIPAGLGAAVNAVGQLHPGKYQWAITHVRLVDGIEGGPAYSNAYVDVTTGGISLSGIPVPAGYRTNVYLTSQYGGARYLAGSTANGLFAFAGANKDLQLHCKTEFCQPAPAGKLLAFWRGRALVAVGKALFASRTHSWELFDLQRDFKPFSANITLVEPVDGGIWVGTEKELVFLAGDKWDSLVRVVKVTGRVVLGSGVKAPGEHVKLGKGRAAGDCMVCIADGWLVAGLPDGSLAPLTLDRYRTAATEVAATFRVVDQVPQYVAVVQ
jgi:hypothetical protein